MPHYFVIKHKYEVGLTGDLHHLTRAPNDQYEVEQLPEDELDPEVLKTALKEKQVRASKIKAKFVDVEADSKDDAVIIARRLGL